MPPKAPDLTPLIWTVIKPLAIIMILMIVGTAIYAALAKYLKENRINFGEDLNPYNSKKPLTETEQILYHKLIEALPECIVLAQVQLSSIIGINKFKAQGEYYKWLNPILQQSVDFLVCLKDFTIVAAIELDDKSHWGEKSKNRDSKKDKNLEAAGITLIRWHAESIPSVEKIKQEFHGN